MHLRILSTSGLALLLLGAIAAPAAAQPEVVAVARRARPAVVTLKTYGPSGSYTGLGSGFFLPDGRIVTNRHVVEGSGRIEIVDSAARVLGSVQYAEAVNGVADLAILPRSVTPPATLRVAAGLPEAGEEVVVIGAPEGLSNTVTTGNVSAVRRMNGRTLVQISAPISHGSSGGPVLNLQGDVIGVSVSMLSEGQNLNFAVPATELNALIRTPPQRIAFTGNLRGGSGGSAGGGSGPDISDQNLSRLPRIALGQTVSGRLSQGDFVRPDGSYADSYVYNGRAGERITVTLRSNDFDSWLVVDDPNGPMREHDDDSAGNLDSQLTVTLPHSGQYLIVANSVAGDATGSYTMSLRSGGAGADDGDSGSGGGAMSTGAEFNLQNAIPIRAGQTVSGRLTTSDTRRGDGSYADSYLYRGRAGERITVTLRSSSFDSWLVVDEPNGPFREHDDDSGGGNDSRLTVTLPRTTNYIILANSVGAASTGPYTLSVQSGGGGGGNDGGYQPMDGGQQPGGTGTIATLGRRNLPRISAGQTVSGRFGPGSFVRSDDNSYAAGYRYDGRAGETITIDMRSSDFDSWVVFDDPNGPMQEHDDDSGGGNDSELTVTLPHDGAYVIVANQVIRANGSYTLSVRSGGGGNGAVVDDQNDNGGSGELSSLDPSTLPTIVPGQVITGRLTTSDFRRSDGSYADAFAYRGRAGERITVTLRSSDFDAWLVVDEPDGPFRETNDDGAGGTDARMTVVLPRSGTYLIVANTLRAGATGRYTLSMSR